MIYCNECKYEFEPKVRIKYIDKDIEEIFFNCPNCNERYTAYYRNDKVKKLQKELNKIPYNKYRRNIIKKQIEKEMNRLEELYSTQ